MPVQPEFAAALTKFQSALTEYSSARDDARAALLQRGRSEEPTGLGSLATTSEWLTSTAIAQENVLVPLLGAVTVLLGEVVALRADLDRLQRKAAKKPKKGKNNN